MTKNLKPSFLYPLFLLLLAGCTTSRNATFANYDYNTVFKAAVASACDQEKLIVYQADKAKGQINTQTRGVFGGQEITLWVKGNTVSASAQGANNPWPDRIISRMQKKITEKPTAQSSPSSQGRNMEIQKLKLDLERLKLDRERLEFEKQKLESGN